MPRPLFEALRNAGFFRLWLPRRFGGPEVDMMTFIRVVEELSRFDGAAGWNVMIGAEGSAFAAYLPEETAHELFAPAHTVVAGSFQPKGDAIPVEAGYRVSGIWPLASGCAHATLMVGACRVTEAGRARSGPNGEPERQVFVIPASECEVIDTWYSGSNAIYASSHLERCFRDVHMITQHRATNVFNFETAGRHFLGVDP
jgi:alkylation response protein AidB-like acyl-CoA dehydrogenase